jgi:cobalt-zinc-cadmium efflux system outer membrane protein
MRLAQVLQGARNNLDVQLAGESVAAARADVQSADHAPLPVLTAKTSQMDLQHGLGGGSLLGDKRIDKSPGWTGPGSAATSARCAPCRPSARPTRPRPTSRTCGCSSCRPG